MLNKWFEITEFGNSKCPKTKTEETYNLIGDIEIEINFKIFINNLNATATFKLYNNERNIGMYVYENRIVFEKNVRGFDINYKYTVHALIEAQWFHSSRVIISGNGLSFIFNGSH